MTLCVQGCSEDEKALYFAEEPGPPDAYCPDCGALMSRSKLYGAEGEFIGWQAEPDPCLSPWCVAKRGAAADRDRAKRSAKRRREFSANVRRNLRIAGLGAKHVGATFENFETTTEESKRALEIAINYADDFESQAECGSGLFLFGPVGTGKTHLAASIMRRIMESGETNIIFTSAPAFVADIQRTFSRQDKQTKREVMQAYGNARLLVLDEVGKERPAQWSMELLGELVYERDAQCRPTIMTSNFSLEELEYRWNAAGCADQCGAIISRINGSMYPVFVDGVDYRTQRGTQSRHAWGD